MSQTTSEKPQDAAERREARAQHRRALYRPGSLVSVGACLLIFALIAIFLLVFPRSTTSQIENRSLAKFPAFSLQSYFSGEFTSGITTFTTTRCPITTASRT